MTTTIMKDSIIGDAWIKEMCERNPVQLGIDPTTGQLNGLILSGPVRLSFPHLIDPAPPNPNSQYVRQGDLFEVTVLFPPYANLALLEEELYKVNLANFKDKLNPHTGQFVGIDNPIRSCDEKFKLNGYTSGLKFTRLSTQFKPGVFDSRQQPVTDKSKVYPGVWAIVAMNAYASGLKSNNPQAIKQARLGVVNVMLVGDDTPLGGGGSAPTAGATFGSVSVRAPATTPGAAFSQAPVQQQQQFGAPATQQFGGAYGQQHAPQQAQFDPTRDPNGFA